MLSTVFIAPNLLAFRADDDFARKQSPAAVPVLKAAPPKMPTAGQKEAARHLDGAAIKWDIKTGAPASIRGQDLSAKNLGGQGLSLSAQNDFANDAIAVMDRLTSVYRLRDASREFWQFKVEADELGFHHVRLNQMYQGLKVVGAELIVHFNKTGKAYQVNGRYIPEIKIETKPEISGQVAVNAAQNDLIKTGKPAGALKGEVKLVVYAQDVEPLLAYELLLVYEGNKAGPGRWHYWVDANDGAIINRYNDVRKSDALISGNLNQLEGGALVTVTGDYSSTNYWLINTNWHWRIFDYVNLRTCRSSTNTWGTNALLRSEMSAAYNFNNVQTYFYNTHARDSYDNTGTQAFVYVHYYYFGSESDNAYWDPETQRFYFYYGITFGELTVLDVCGHEFTHAVTEKTCDLVYQYESGALNESFSDIFGTIIEFACQPDGRGSYPDKTAGYADWLIGEDCIKTQTALRDMRNPQRYSDPSRYHGTHWYYGSEDNGGVHYNSGVQNHFFYLLCDGGSGNNDGLSYNITGLGITNARAIAYRALSVYCTHNSDYAGARLAWISAAQDLNPSWVSTVQAAWAAVGISENTRSHSARFRAFSLSNDFDGDNKADYAVYHYLTGNWYVLSSLTSNWLAYGDNFGSLSYLPVPGDYDGNGKSDGVVYSPSTAWWLIYFMGVDSVDAFQWGSYDCIPAPGDYDGDGKTDLALYHTKTGQWWIFQFSSLTWLTYGDVFGCPGYVPVPGDYNGGGQSDVVIYSEADAVWHIVYTETMTYEFKYFGGPGYIPIPGDYDADGATDFALYLYWDYAGYNEPGAWYIWSPVNGWILDNFQWGGVNYLPVPGDYDGDAISDLAVYSSVNGDWYVYYMGTGESTHSSEVGALYLVPIVYWSLYAYM
jgi:Zn-dependent metalloprotease